MMSKSPVVAILLACATAGAIAAERETSKPVSVTSVSAFVQAWQAKILGENLAVPDARTWAARSLPKLAAFSTERLQLAMSAATIDELEALMVAAPIANGTNLALLVATKPGNISVDAMQPAAASGAVHKLDPTSDPTLYSDLAFTSLNPCRILDSRFSAGGKWLNGGSQAVKVGPYPTGYSTGAGAQGGSATSCGLDTLASGNQVAAVMLAVSSFNQTAAGYLTFSSFSTPDPSLSVVSMFYTAGPVQTAFVVVPTDRVAPVVSKGISRGADTHVALDIVGYFAKPLTAALDCTTTSGGGTAITAGGSGSDVAPACAAGYSQTGLTCNAASALLDLSGLSGLTCTWTNNDAAPHTGTAGATCCRTAGR